MKILLYRCSLVAIVIVSTAFVFVFFQKRASDRRLAQKKIDERVTTEHRVSAEMEFSKVHDEIGALVKAKTKAAGRSKTSAQNNSVTVLKEASDNPRVQNLRRAARHAWIARTYAPLFRALRLGAESAESVIQLKLQHEEQQTDIRAASFSQLGSASDGATIGLLAKADDEYRSGLMQFLNDNEYAALQRFEKSAPIRDAVSRIVGPSVTAGTPIASEQAERLTEVMVNASSSPSANEPNRLTIDWSAVDLQARSILSPGQYASFISMESGEIDSSTSRSLGSLNSSIDKAIRADAMIDTAKP